jgi:hypothetical protein
MFARVTKQIRYSLLLQLEVMDGMSGYFELVCGGFFYFGSNARATINRCEPFYRKTYVHTTSTDVFIRTFMILISSVAVRHGSIC